MLMVRVAPPGEATQTALFIRDRTQTVTSFGRTPGIAGRYRGLDWQRQVLVVALVIRVRTPQDPQFYRLWLNLRESASTTAHLVDLAVQPKLTFQFFGDGGRPLTACTIRNPFQDFSRAVLKQLEEYPAWDQDQFSRAVAEFTDRYRTAKSLWEGLARINPSEVPTLLIRPTSPPREPVRKRERADQS
ncbi:MAG: hypothetical protein AB1411_04185 [Nitrospirota bacterium]